MFVLENNDDSHAWRRNKKSFKIVNNDHLYDLPQNTNRNVDDNAWIKNWRYKNDVVASRAYNENSGNGINFVRFLQSDVENSNKRNEYVDIHKYLHNLKKSRKRVNVFVLGDNSDENRKFMFNHDRIYDSYPYNDENHQSSTIYKNDDVEQFHRLNAFLSLMMKSKRKNNMLNHFEISDYIEELYRIQNDRKNNTLDHPVISDYIGNLNRLQNDANLSGNQKDMNKEQDENVMKNISGSAAKKRKEWNIEKIPLEETVGSK